MPKQDGEVCTGAYYIVEDEDYIERPNLTVDNWGFKVGSRGKVKCPECHRTIGVIQSGKGDDRPKIARHFSYAPV